MYLMVYSFGALGTVDRCSRHTTSDAVNKNRSAQGPRKVLEVVGIARDHKIPAGKRSGDHGCVDNVASARPRARDPSGASTCFVEVLDSAAS
jgi:hypothetical protein